MVSQLAGGITAALCATAAFGEFSNFGPAGKYTWVEAGIAETLYTFMSRRAAGRSSAAAS